MDDIFERIVQLLDQGEGFALATLCSRTGSAPRAAGARMLIRTDGSIVGTIGGGLLEARVQQAAAGLFQDKKALVLEFLLTGRDASQTDMLCGGNVEVLIDWIDAGDDTCRQVYAALPAAKAARRRAWLLTTIPDGEGRTRRCLVQENGPLVGEAAVARLIGVGSGSPIGLFGTQPSCGSEQFDIANSRQPVVIECQEQRLLVEPILGSGTVYILGAGHISQQLAPLVKTVGFATVVLDDRPEFARRERFATADQVIVLDSFERALEGLPINQDSYLVIVTRGHLHDKTALTQALRTAAGYIGMIGSRRKRELVYRALVEGEGFTEQDLARVHSPIGLAIGAESPEEIAVSIVAELIQARAGRS
jgi:xanthine dehydrogenase accessory factor